jgi:DNA-binding winged helix-turn-helix (wHTH) protein
VWGYDRFIETRSVDVHVGRLRAKLGAVGQQIETVVGLGYRFVHEVSIALGGLKGAAGELSTLINKSGSLGERELAAAKGALSEVSKHIDRVESILDRTREICTGTRICR